LAIEALLELFVKLLPSRRDAAAAQERIKFIEEVFDSTTFTCALDIVEFFQSPTTPDWEEIFGKLVMTLAIADITLWVQSAL